MNRLSKSVLIVSFHDWRSKRLAGFHKIGEALLEGGYDVCFMSHYRPLALALFNKDKVNCFSNWRALMKGISYKFSGVVLTNYTALNLALPGPLRRGPLNYLNEWLLSLSARLFARKCKAVCPCPECIIIESGSSLLAYADLKRVYPKVKLIYRPSDPSIGSIRPSDALISSERQLVRDADSICLVNEQGRRMYLENAYELNDARTHMLPNGIDLEAFGRQCPAPDLLAVGQSVCYVGGHPPDWSAILAFADKRPDVRVVVVCPEALPVDIAKAVEARKELYYIEGLDPEQVPAYVTNASVMIIPYPSGWAERPLGLHGKVMQAMYAKKPIVATHLDPSLADLGVFIESTPADFAARVEELLLIDDVEYALDFSERDWSVFKQRFMEICEL